MKRNEIVKTLSRCRLCGEEAELQLGHIFPRFAVKWLKQTSATGFLRNTASHKRKQDSERQHLMCRECEQIFSRDEKLFAENLFIPYHERKQTAFDYGAWLLRFIAGLHWKVLATRDPSEVGPEGTKEICDVVEGELRCFLLGQSNTPGRAEFHLFLADEVRDANYDAPPKINWYMTRSLDADVIFNKSGTVGVYAKMLKMMSVSFLTPRNLTSEKWEGTQIFDNGTLRTPQHIESKGLGPFLEDRMRVVEQSVAALPLSEKRRIADSARTNRARVLASESYQVHLADRELREQLAAAKRDEVVAKFAAMKGRDRNRPCFCGSGKKYKRCHGK